MLGDAIASLKCGLDNVQCSNLGFTAFSHLNLGVVQNDSTDQCTPSLKIIYLSLTKRDKGGMDVRNLVSEQLGARACSTVESIIYAGDEG